MEKKIVVKSESLKSWNNLNEAMRNADEKLCAKLMAEERKGRRRKEFMLRIHSRLNKVRADREREEINKVAQQ